MATSDLDFPLDEAAVVVAVALAEDLGGADGVDVTTESTIDPAARATAQVVARAEGVIAGMPLVELVFGAVCDLLGDGRAHGDLPRDGRAHGERIEDGRAHGERIGVEPSVVVTPRVVDGERVRPGTVLAELDGSAQAILIGERTLLNLLSRLSGVATRTRTWADALEGFDTTVLDTRKTTPGLRVLEKYAVRAGGATNKRMGLFDTAMIKDNHKLAAGSITAAYERVRERFPDVDVEVEVTTTAEALEAIAAGARFVMCDNMSAKALRAAVAAIRDTGEAVEIEATGGLTLERAAAYAATGVDYLSVGALTHSAPILDIALDLT